MGNGSCIGADYFLLRRCLPGTCCDHQCDGYAGSERFSVLADGSNQRSFPFDLPSGAVADNAKADTQASQEITDNRIFASKLTFIILSVIFVGVQLIGILIGIYRSFAGIESKAAAKYIGNFSGSEEFASWHAMRRERVERDGQEKLTALQNRLMMKRTNSQSEPLTTLPTFDDYISGKLRDKARSNAELTAHLQAKNEPVQPAPVVQPVAVQHVESAPAEVVSQPAVHAPTATVVEPVQAAQPVTSAVNTPESDDEKQRIHELGDLTLFSEEELQLIADDQGLSLESLKKRQRVQALLNKARPKESV